MSQSVTFQPWVRKSWRKSSDVSTEGQMKNKHKSKRKLFWQGKGERERKKEKIVRTCDTYINSVYTIQG